MRDSERLAVTGIGMGAFETQPVAKSSTPHGESESVSEAADAVPSRVPEFIGRYRIEKVIGQGGFGLVYLAHDDQLQRLVAIKVPHSKLVAQAHQAEAYLVEARTVANLDNPHIVPVYDVGSTADHPCFVVSKFIDGTDLAARLKLSRLRLYEAAELVATVAEALHQAHKQGLVHRDIKPGNILLDKNGKPFVADFGLALREQDAGHGARYAGTPAYMSPEQARGEGHRVDGRSDVFSLGVVFYELLTARRPFKGVSLNELLEQITSVEVRPPRQIDDSVPKELERICFKAMAKRAAERYSTAQDLADDLRQFLAQAPSEFVSAPPRPSESVRAEGAGPTPSPATTAPLTRAPTLASESRVLKIVPKGLRSYDAHDADFFLELLPGPRDRDGLPDSIRFWKTRIEERDADQTFAVGLIYGPSGCGKSSLVKAGLLPALSDEVIAIYVEATGEETEVRLLAGLRKRCGELPAQLGLKETLAALRLQRGVLAGKKVLIILDQFEQWLHAKKDEQHTDLVQALRQCDGAHVQLIVMVRDDFWMAATRFMRDLEIQLLEGQNSAAVDLFPIRHAERVLAAFGRAFGVLPETAVDLGNEQRQFLTLAVAGLAQEGKVISVRLSLVAEMLKGKPWTPATLKEVGGMEGVGITFLEETFSASTAPPKHRFHQKAARAVLKALLPEAGADIKGHMRSSADLLDASGYASRPRDFSDLIRILDSEIRLITPTDPDGAGDDGDDPVKAAGGQKYYQLTHDYLVHSLREWLTRKQKETRRGRAELRLAERAATWFARRENRQLPSLWEYIHIRLLTDKKRWTAQERKMVRKAGKVHLTRSSLGVLSLALVAAIGLSIWGQIQQDREKDHAASLVQQLTSAEIGMVPEIAGAIAQQRRWADPLLNREFEAAPFGSVQKLHAALALLPVDSDGSKSLYLREQLLAVTSGQFPVVRDALQPYREAIIEPLWSVALDMPSDSRASFQAACALATFAPQDSRWSQINRPVVDHLLALEASELVAWRTALEPAWKQLMQPLAAVYRSTTEREQARMYAAETLAEYAADDPDALFDLLADADQFQFPKIYGKLAGHRERVAELGIRELARQPVAEADETEKEQGGRRRANVAIALARIGAAEHVWAMLKHSPDSRARSNFIQWLSPLGGDAQTILRRFNEEHDVSIRRALLLALGEFSEKQLPVAERAAFVEKLYTLYENDPDPGLHAAAEWLLRMWNQEAWLKQKNETWAAASQATGEGSARIDPAAKPPAPKKLWYVNSQGQTFVILAAADIQMGSPLSDPDRELDEVPHVRRIGRTLAIASKEVTKSEYRRFLEANPNVPRPDFEKYCPYDDSPQVLVSWYDAARYCNWLSKMDGLPEDQWCYEANEKGEFAEGMRPAADFLVRTGYRLPTEAEWEFACRAGTVNSRHYGADASLLKRYAWFVENSPKAHAMRIGLLKPNDFGLFDMLGNVLEWCHDAYGKYPLADNGGAVNDAAATNTIEEKNDRVLRGGSFTYVASLIRSSVRVSYRPGALAYSVGMRPARTYRGAP